MMTVLINISVKDMQIMFETQGHRFNVRQDWNEHCDGVLPVARRHYYTSYCHLIILTCLHTPKYVHLSV